MKALYTILVFLLVNSSWAQDGELTGFNAGRIYYRNSNKVIDGLVKLISGPGETKVRFKENKSAKATKLQLDDIASLVIEKDSFAVISRIGTEFSYVPKGVVRIHSLDSIKVYVFQQTFNRPSGAGPTGFFRQLL